MPNTNPNPNFNPNHNHNPNPKKKKKWRINDVTSISYRWKLVFTSNNVYKAASLASTDDDFQDFDFLSIYIYIYIYTYIEWVTLRPG